MAGRIQHPNGIGVSIASEAVSSDTDMLRVKLAVGNTGVDGGDVSASNPMPVSSSGTIADYSPGYSVVTGESASTQFDPSGQMKTRGPILTDEGGYRANFANASLAVSIGSCTFTNGSDTVTGVGFSDKDIHLGDYVYLDADGVGNAAQVDEFTDTTITLNRNYTGTGGTGLSSRQYLLSVVGEGGTITVSGGQATIAAGTTASAVFELERDVDYLPLTKVSRLSISQRIANQDIYVGFYDEGAPARWYYWFHFTGTTNTTVNCVCGWNPTTAPSGGEIVTQAVTIPNGLTSASLNEYRIDIMKDRTVFSISGIPVYTETKVTPHPHDFLTSTIRVVNGTTPAGNTNVVLDFDACSNYNVVSVENPNRSTDFVATQPPLDRFQYSQAGVITINTVLLTVDCSKYKSLSWQCTSMGTTGVVTPEWSADAATWVGDTFFTAAGASATTFNAAGAWNTNVRQRYFRLRLSTATTGGTTTIYIDGCQVRQQYWLATQPISGSISLTSTRITSNAADGHSTTNHLISANTTNATSVKGSAGQVGIIQASNINAAFRYLKLYNKATAPTVGTDTPVMTIALPPNSNQFLTLGSPGMRFSAGIAYALTTGIAVADTGAVGAAEHSVSIFYT